MHVLQRYGPFLIGGIGVCLIAGSATLVGQEGTGQLPAAAVGTLGFLALALANTLFVRDRADTFQRERPAAILLVWVGVGTVVLGGLLAPSDRLRVAALLGGGAVLSAGYLWNKRLIRRKDVVTTDERIETLSDRAAHRAYQVISVGLVGAYGFVQFTEGELPTAEVLLWLLIIGIVSRIGFFEYYRRSTAGDHP